MKMTFRWYGDSDPVSLSYISQIPMMSGIVSAVYDVPVGEVWPTDRIEAIKQAAHQHNLAFEVVESVPVHEHIKMGAPDAGHLIDVFCENVRRLGAAGVKVICYNFMPVFDWLRSDLKRELADGSNALAYDDSTVKALDPATSDLDLPGWDASYTKEGLRALLAEYKLIDEEKLWQNFATFIRRVAPVCEASGVKMAIHPDDPPWGIFGLPRIITGAAAYRRMREIEPSLANGITLCTGSLGANPGNTLTDIIAEFAERIHFVHARNIKYTGERCFEESAHPTQCGSLDMYAILKALHDAGFEGYVRPDHGRMIWGETGRPGYGLYDRALGAVYLTGVWEALDRGGK